MTTQFSGTMATTASSSGGVDCVFLSCFDHNVQFFASMLGLTGIRLHSACTVEAADFLLLAAQATVLVVDTTFLDGSWEDALAMIGQVHPLVATLIYAEFVDRAFLVNARERGAFDVLWRPIELERLRTSIRTAHEATVERRLWLTERERDSPASPTSGSGNLHGNAKMKAMAATRAGFIPTTDSRVVLIGRIRWIADSHGVRRRRRDPGPAADPDVERSHSRRISAANASPGTDSKRSISFRHGRPGLPAGTTGRQSRRPPLHAPGNPKGHGCRTGAVFAAPEQRRGTTVPGAHRAVGRLLARSGTHLRVDGGAAAEGGIRISAR